MAAELLERVRGCVAKVVAVPADQVKPESRLTEDLGFDSLDLVELMFALEQEFAIRLDQADMSLSAQLGLPDAEIHQNEVLTPKALELLRARFPGGGEILKPGVTRKQLAALVTLDGIAQTVERKLAKG